MTDYNKAVKEWLLKCPEIKADKFYFNFLEDDMDAKGLLTVKNIKTGEDILGNEKGEIQFSLVDLKKISSLDLAHNDDNVSIVADLGKIIEWIEDQEKKRNFPDFGENITVDTITVMPAPVFNGIGSSGGVPLARYTTSISIKYEKYI